jgi:glycerol-3-phosphate dehydrogenase
VIRRDVDAAEGREFDLVIVGGGIYGASLLQAAAERGLSACLLEARDFGGQTSWNSLRIVHGGLRYLQSMDLRRFFQSVAARRRLALRFPALVRPLKCLMPLYAQGLKRKSVMRVALQLNDALSVNRNADLPAAVKLPGSDVIGVEDTRRVFPGVREDGLEGAARWYDYLMVSSERILMELLRDACRNGAMALNYAPAEELLVRDDSIVGVRVRDALSGDTSDVRGRHVVNCAGPQVRTLASGGGGDTGKLFRPSLAFNLLLDVSLESDHALAVAPPRPGAPILFVVPQDGAVLAGTRHLPRGAEDTEAVPTEAEILEFLQLLNEAIPGLDARIASVRRVFAGLLPATRAGGAELVKREVLMDHGKAGGPKGFYSVSGVKYTTAGDVAGQTLRMMGLYRPASADDEPLPLSAATPLLVDTKACLRSGDAEVLSVLRRVVQEESVQCAEDLLLRRMNWAMGPIDVETLLEDLAGRLNIPPRSEGDAR